MKSFLRHIITLCLVVSTAYVAIGQIEKTDPTPNVSEIKIFPNPVQDVFQITHPEAVKYISIYNISGKELKRMEVRGNKAFSIDELNKGIYILRLFDHKNEPLKVMRLNKR